MGGSEDDPESTKTASSEDNYPEENSPSFTTSSPPTDPAPSSPPQSPEWKALLGIGMLFVFQTWFDITPEGPWGSARFTNGVIGLTGLGLIYLAWFRYTFNIKGILPTIDRWKNPTESLPKVALTAVLTCVLAWLAGGPLNAHFPEPAGMILGLIGSLILLQSIYVWLTLGPLAD